MQGTGKVQKEAKVPEPSTRRREALCGREAGSRASRTAARLRLPPPGIRAAGHLGKETHAQISSSRGRPRSEVEKCELTTLQH